MNTITNEQVKAHKPQLLAYAIKTTNRDIAEDMVQETFAQAVASWDSFDGANLGGWLMTILKRKVLNHFRYEKSRPQSGLSINSDDWQTSYEPLTEDTYFGAEFSPKVKQALDQLQPQFREVLVLLALDFSYDEIALIQEASRGTIGSRILRAKAQLAELLKEVA